MTTVLFVDDEPLVLEGLQRLARVRRGALEVHTAIGGAAALDLLGKKLVDVVVSDMRMPNMDGAQLLAEVQQRHPATLRVLLSGQTELDAALRAVPLAHLFLSKPCEQKVLLAAVERLGVVLGRAPVECVHALLTISMLPIGRARAEKLDELLAADDAPIDAIAAETARDVALSAKVLQLARSSFFGGVRTMTDPREAVTLLGPRVLRHVINASPRSDDPACDTGDGPLARELGLLVLATLDVPMKDVSADAIGDVLFRLWGVSE